MLRETMDTINEAESKAEEIERKAREEADFVIAEAKKKAEDIEEAARVKARYEQKQLEEELKLEDEKMSVKAADLAVAEAGHLRDKAARLEDESIEMIISELV